MKILLYTEGLRLLKTSGIGKAIFHQKKALELAGINYTLSPNSCDYDIVHINTIGPRSAYLAKKAHRMGKKVIIHAHSTEEDFRNSFILSNRLAPLFKRRLVYIYNLADTIVTPTPYSKSLLESYNLRPPIRVISNGIDLTKFHHDAKKGQAFREKYGLSQKKKIILSVGLQIQRKGILDFLDIAQKLPEYLFIWCGTTPRILMPRHLKKQLRHLPENVHFLGYINDMPSAYAASDLFFSPTYEETEGIVLLEALASQIPVLVRDIPVYDSWLENHHHCYKASDNPSFIRGIRAILSHSLPCLKSSGLEVVKERSLDEIGGHLNQLYKETLSCQ